jgi:hypothetical protein
MVVLLATFTAAPAVAAPIYTFDALAVGTTTTFSDVSDGVTATFSSPDATYSVTTTFFDSLTGNVLFDANGVPTTLDVGFSAPFSAFSLNFALNGDAAQTLSVEAFSGGVGGTLLGTVTATGAVPVGFVFPEGFATLDLGPSNLFFDTLRITSTAADFAIDDLALRGPGAAPVPEPASLTLLGLGLAGMAGRRWRQRKA